VTAVVTCCTPTTPLHLFTSRQVTLYSRRYSVHRLGRVAKYISCRNSVTLASTNLASYLSAFGCHTNHLWEHCDSYSFGLCNTTVFQKRPNFLNSAPTITESALRLLSAPSVYLVKQLKFLCKIFTKFAAKFHIHTHVVLQAHSLSLCH
jgi:hypothetical protein